MQKEYLTLHEAASLVDVSPVVFRRNAINYGISSRRFMNRRMYRRADIEAALKYLWHLGGNQKQFPLDVQGAVREARDLISRLQEKARDDPA